MEVGEKKNKREILGGRGSGRGRSGSGRSCSFFFVLLGAGSLAKILSVKLGLAKLGFGQTWFCPNLETWFWPKLAIATLGSPIGLSCEAPAAVSGDPPFVGPPPFGPGVLKTKIGQSRTGQSRNWRSEY